MRLNIRKELGLLGLAARAGKVVSGEFATEKAVKSGKAHLVLVAEDASDNTKKKISDMCVWRGVPLFLVGEKEELGSAIGKDYRASVGVTDMNFAVAIKNQLEQKRE